VIRLDYLMHFCEYGLLTIIAFLSFAGIEFKIAFKKYIIILMSLIFFAVLDEFHQKLIPGRSFNPSDILSNISGIFAATVFTRFLFRYIGKKVKKE
jgi:VanZ family protein